MERFDAGTILFFIAILLMGLGCGGRAGVRGGPPALPYEWKEIRTVDLRDTFTIPINSVLDKLPTETAPTAPVATHVPQHIALPELADVASAAPRRPIRVVLIPRTQPIEDLGACVDPVAVFAVIAKRAEASAVVPSRIPAEIFAPSHSAAWPLFASARNIAASTYRAQLSQPAVGIMAMLAMIAILIRPRRGRLAMADSLASASSRLSTRSLAPLPAISQRTRTPRQ